MTMAGFICRQISIVIVLSTLCLLSPIVLAEIRVIVEYEGAHHHIVRVVELPSRQPAPMSDHLDAKTKASFTPTDAMSKVKLLWFSADGEMISTAVMDDPRLTHAPLTGSDQSPAVVSLNAGAFVVSGPSESAVLEIHLPANTMLGLDQQFWRMMLVR